MEFYLEVARGSVANRNFVDEASKIKDYVILAQKSKEELYRSVYTYDNEILEHLKIRKTVKSYAGKYYLDSLIFDIDKGTNTDEFTKERAQQFVMRLADDWQVDRDSIRIWFSGRGYHFAIDNIFRFEPSNHMPDEVKATVAKFFPEIDSSIYTTSALIRVGYTINNKVLRYKVPITYDELFELSCEEIITIAQSPDIRDLEKVTLKSNLDFSHYIVKSTRTPAEVKRENNLTDIVTCVQKIYNEGPIEGSRHMKMLRMISSFKRRGLPKSAIQLLMQSWASNMEQYEITKNVNDVFSKEYKFGCYDPILSKYCDPMCMYFLKKNMLIDSKSAEDMEKDFIEFLKGDFLSRSINLKDVLGLTEDFWCYPGEFIMFIGDTKLGKSAFTQLMALKIKLKTLYYNLEYSDKLFFRRNIQIRRNWTKEQVYQHYATQTTSLKAGTEHIEAIFRPPYLEEVPKTIKDTGANVVIIDTLDKILVGKLGEYKTKEEKLGMLLKDYSASTDTIIIGVHHIPKSEAYDSMGNPKMLNTHSGKGSSVLEQQADKIIGMWGKEKDGIRFVKSLGARDERGFYCQFYYNKPTFRFTRILDIEE